MDTSDPTQTVPQQSTAVEPAAEPAQTNRVPLDDRLENHRLYATMPATTKCGRCGNHTRGTREGGVEYCTACGGELPRAK